MTTHTNKKQSQKVAFKRPSLPVIKKHLKNLGLPEEHCKQIAEMLIGERMEREIRNSFAGNTIVEYPSRKMGLLIECESLSIEYARVLELEFDPDVLWYSTQPTSLSAPRVNSNGTEIPHRFTPDILIVTSDDVWFEEGKPWDQLEKKISEGSSIYKRDADRIRHLPGERNAFGVGFRVFTDRDVSRISIANFEFLHNHHVNGEVCPTEDLANIHEVLDYRREATIQELNGEFEIPLASIHAALASSELTWLPQVDRISEPERCRIFLNAAYAESALEARNSRAIQLPIGSLVPFGNVSWTLMGIKGSILELAYEGNIQSIDIEQLPAETQKVLQEKSIPHRCPASLYRDDMVQAAQKRMIALRTWEQTGTLPVWEDGTKYTLRTLQSWRKKRNQGVDHGLTELEALMPAKDRQGARSKQIPNDIEELARKYLRTRYLSRNAPSLVSVLKELNRKISERWDPTMQISESTFRRYAGDLDQYKSTQLRHGKRRANQVKPSYNVMSGQPKQDGDYSLHVVEFDHTEADVKIIGEDGRPKDARLALTVALDSYSRYPLCWILTESDKKGGGGLKKARKKIDPHFGKENSPSNRRSAQLIQMLVTQYKCLPTRIHTDNGTDFEGGVLHSFLKSHGIIKSKRPPGDPVRGPIVERFFKSLNEGLLHNLPGNTADLAPKHARMNSLSHRPKNLASLTLPVLRQLTDTWIEEDYKKTENTGIRTTPNLKFLEGLQRQSVLRAVAFTEEELSRATSPYAGDYTVSTDGVKIDGFWYFTDQFRYSKWKGKKVSVRVDPVDVSRVFVLLDGTWVAATSEHRRALRDELLKDKLNRSSDLRTSVAQSRARKRQEVKPGAGVPIVTSKAGIMNAQQAVIEKRKSLKENRDRTATGDAA